VYIHIPFCKSKCTYCHFNAYAGMSALFDAYTDALVREIETVGASRPHVPQRASTLYLGGGTPSVMPLAYIERILEACRRVFAVDVDAEVTLEANPATADQAYFAGLRALGVNRLSLGAQTFDDVMLRRLARAHTARDIGDAYIQARRAGFENINLDLLYGLPGQTLDDWRKTLRRAIEFEPEHLSLYALTVDEGTPLERQIVRGQMPMPDDDLTADMYVLAEEMLEERGYVQYEISNWAKGKREIREREEIRGNQGKWRGNASRHNLIYWHNLPFLGFGAGAHGYWRGKRYWNVLSPQEYVARIQRGESPVAGAETIGRELEMAETVILGLRLVGEGMEFKRFEERFGCSLSSVYEAELTELRALGLIEMDSERVRLTRPGRLLGNEVFVRFLPDSNSAADTL